MNSSTLTSQQILELPDVKMAQRIVTLENAVRDFLCYSPRYCELNDKFNASTIHDDDEMQEFIALRKMHACLSDPPIIKLSEARK